MPRRAPGAFIKAILFDVGGVLLPFSCERRVSAISQALDVPAGEVESLFGGELPRLADLGLADENDYAVAFSRLGRRHVSPSEARDLILTVLEAPNLQLWSLARSLSKSMIVGGFSDNPQLVRRAFPDPDLLDPMIFSADIGHMKPTSAAFTAVENRLGLAGEAILLIDDVQANVDAAVAQGWGAIQFVSNAKLSSDLEAYGIRAQLRPSQDR